MIVTTFNGECTTLFLKYFRIYYEKLVSHKKGHDYTSPRILVNLQVEKHYCREIQEARRVEKKPSKACLTRMTGRAVAKSDSKRTGLALELQRIGSCGKP